MNSRLAVFTLFLTTSATLCGCGGEAPYTGDTRFPLTGKIVYRAEPISSGTLSLVPESGGLNPSGGTITNGEFQIPEEKGPNKGRYRVQVYWHKPTGKKIKDSDTGEEIDQVEQVIPPKYNDATELTVDITGDPEKDKLELTLQ